MAALLKIKHGISLDEMLLRGLYQEMLRLRVKPGSEGIPIPEALWDKVNAELATMLEAEARV